MNTSDVTQRRPARRSEKWSRVEPRAAELSDTPGLIGGMAVSLYRFVGQMLSAYRLLAVAVAVPLLIAFPMVNRYHDIVPVSELFLVSAACIYTFLKTIEPVEWHRVKALNAALYGLDITVCAFLINVSGGLHSPFELYTLAPVVRAALSQDVRTTVLVSAVTGIYVFAGFISNPIPLVTPAAAAVDFSVYGLTLALATVLPFLVNSRLIQVRRLQSLAIVQERERLSRQIHDGMAQVLYGLRWHVQNMARQEAAAGRNSNEMQELVKLSDEAEKSTRESLDLLQTIDGDEGLLPQLMEQLHGLERDTGIKCAVDIDDEPHADELVSLELLYIAQEALRNVKKHSGARNLTIKLRTNRERLQMTITDDGRGFTPPLRRSIRRSGLDIMKERAESVDGQLRVVSAPEQGTRIDVEVPMSWTPSWLGLKA